MKNNNLLEQFLKEKYNVNGKELDVYTILLKKLLNIIITEKNISHQLQAIKILLEEKKDYLKTNIVNTEDNYINNVSINFNKKNT